MQVDSRECRGCVHKGFAGAPPALRKDVTVCSWHPTGKACWARMSNASSQKKQDRVIVTLTMAVVGTLVISYGALSGWGKVGTVVAVGLVFGSVYAIVDLFIKRRRRRR